MITKSILITGSTGFLGRTLLNSLKNKCEVSELDKPNGVNTIRLEKQIPKFQKSFDLVIHAAWKAHVYSKHKIDKEQYFNTNVNGTINLLKGLENSHIPKSFIFISSVSVYGLTSGENIKESTALNASDEYGKNKIQAEILIQKWCNKHKVVCSILRLPLIVGSNPPGNLGSMINGIRKGYYFNIGGGIAKKSMVMAEDISESILRISEIGGIYNLTDGFHPNFFQLSNEIAIILKKPKPKNIPLYLAWLIAKFGDIFGSSAIINSDKLKKIISTLTFDDSKARKEFGWSPKPILDRLNNLNFNE